MPLVPYKRLRTGWRCVENTYSTFDLRRVFSNLIQEPTTIDLADYWYRFVSRYFEIIRASSQHIYTSALALASRAPIVQKLYELHARPFVRVLCGEQGSRDSSIATARCAFEIGLVVWSSCNMFIAIGARDSMNVEILDPATLQQLRTLELSSEVSARPEALIFSPDSRMLACSGRDEDLSDQDVHLVNWDLQTGGVVSAIKRRGRSELITGRTCIAYSTNGKLVAVLYQYLSSSIISIYDVASGAYLHNVDHGADVGHFLFTRPRFYDIWTHGESLRFALIGSGTIPIREVGLFPGATPTEVEILCAPDYILDPSTTQFFSASYRLAFTGIGRGGGAKVWSARDSKFLLHCTDGGFYPRATFSSDGRLFACSTVRSEILLWKESSGSYTLHGRFASIAGGDLSPFLSPNGESIVTSGGFLVRLWHTRNLPFSITPPRVPRLIGEDFALEFLQSGRLAAFARQRDSTVVVLDLKSSLPPLTIDTGMDIFGLGGIENTIVVIGYKKISTWSLPRGDFPSGARMNVDDSARIINFGLENYIDFVISTSISPDFCYIALITESGLGNRNLHVYSTSSGKLLAFGATRGRMLWFAPGGRSICCAVSGSEVEEIAIIQDDSDHSTPETDVEHQSWGRPWVSSRGYQVTNDWWVLGPDGRRLLMLPPAWRSDATRWVWNGQFLALLHSSLPEPVILEFDP